MTLVEKTPAVKPESRWKQRANSCKLVSDIPTWAVCMPHPTHAKKKLKKLNTNRIKKTNSEHHITRGKRIFLLKLNTQS